jgi:hypothetical protein
MDPQERMCPITEKIMKLQTRKFIENEMTNLADYVQKYPAAKNIAVVFCAPKGYASSYPWKTGETLLYIGEMHNMGGHGVFVPKKGRIVWGYHLDNFYVEKHEEFELETGFFVAGFSYYKTSSWSMLAREASITSFAAYAAKGLALNLDGWMAASLKEGWPEMTKNDFYDKVMQEALDYYRGWDGPRDEM